MTLNESSQCLGHESYRTSCRSQLRDLGRQCMEIPTAEADRLQGLIGRFLRAHGDVYRKNSERSVAYFVLDETGATAYQIKLTRTNGHIFFQVMKQMASESQPDGVSVLEINDPYTNRTSKFEVIDSGYLHNYLKCE